MVGATIGRPPCCGFARSFSKTIHPAARAIDDRPYKCKNLPISLVGDGLPDVPAVKCYGFALACGEFVLSTARAVGDAGPYKGKAEQPAKLKFEVPSAALVERINHRFLPQFVTN